MGYLLFWRIYLYESFKRNSCDIGTLVPNNYEFLVCLSVCQSTYLLDEIRQIQEYLHFQMIYLFEIFCRHSWNMGRLVPNNCELLVCLSVCQMAYFLTEIGLIQGYLQFWMRYLSELFWRLSWNKFTMNPKNFEFLVCLSVCQLAYFLTEIRLIQIYIQFRMRYLS